MTISELLQIADLGSTLVFAALVYIEVKSMRKESLTLMQTLAGYIQGKSVD